MTGAEARAWAYLSRVAEPPCALLAALVATFGPEDAAERVRRGEVADELVKLTVARRDLDCAAEDLETLAKLGGRLVTSQSAEWPHYALSTLAVAEERPASQSQPPLVLWAMGPERLVDVAERACAIVGTRAATSYGEYVAGDFAAGLVERDVAVVSGGAYGIDGVAHRAALAAGGVTLAVLACGIDVPYPAGHAAMLRRIGREGLVVTEYPPGERPARYRFLTRNRLVAALSGATVVVEAGLRSGAASTAAWARSLNRPVCAVPGPITSASSAGCHVLLRDGANLVTRAADVVEFVGRIGELGIEPHRPTGPLDDLTNVERQVYEALPARAARTADQISVAAGVPVERVFGPLAALELAGLVARRNGRWQISRDLTRLEGVAE
ncbi:DNA-processing protein DprA [Mycolicibacterium sediminis]|uniref:Putative DNA processing protein DprA n=1 Tax=Mycolicibacterium sediminis TaxID=1286180 RepID=A0A7I7QSP5_9MYCO|nr:DNA-processing protein DprA [Mycolicibacterium sediminis]BBY29321.1 putative DNA processing protein DprA [Mycolicibacterium sediminis]